MLFFYEKQRFLFDEIIAEIYKECNIDEVPENVFDKILHETLIFERDGAILK